MGRTTANKKKQTANPLRSNIASGNTLLNNKTVGKAGPKKTVATSKTAADPKTIVNNKKTKASKNQNKIQKAGISGDIDRSAMPVYKPKVTLPEYIIPDMATIARNLSSSPNVMYENAQSMKRKKRQGKQLLIDDPQYLTRNKKEMRRRALDPLQTTQEHSSNVRTRLLREYGEHPFLTGGVHGLTSGLFDDGETRLKILGSGIDESLKLAEIKESPAYRSGEITGDLASYAIPAGILGKSIKAPKLGTQFAKYLSKTPWLSEQAANALGQELATSLITDGIVSSAKNGLALSQKPFSKDAGKEFTKNVALDIATGIGIDFAVPALKGIYKRYDGKAPTLGIDGGKRNNYTKISKREDMEPYNRKDEKTIRDFLESANTMLQFYNRYNPSNPQMESKTPMRTKEVLPRELAVSAAIGMPSKIAGMLPRATAGLLARKQQP